jgi:protein-S-isoprenylcysteine O-methyltransferase Ste14
MLGVLAATASVLWVIAPGWLAWAALPLPTALRWSGIVVGVITILLFFWVHRTLGKNWAMPGEIKERHTLITTGPYRWVRHPMYTTLFVWALAYFLMSANALIGLAWLGLGLVAAAMAGDEEAALLETFGETYQTYLQEVGRFWPRWN